MLYCLMLDGPTLTDQIRALLFDTAQSMFKKKTKRKSVKTDYCEGSVSTQWKTSGIGGTYGIFFQAILEVKKGTTKVDFIIRPSDVSGDELTWLDHEVPKLPPIHLN